MTEVNGWKNRETWLVGLWMMDDMFENFEDEYHDGADIHMDDIKDLVLDTIEEIHIEGKVHSGLGQDLLNTALAQVDWRELETALNDRLKENYELTEEVGGDYD
tara:strand:- start:493 stop:804 length:312 start_codon:yes stop_codon:yes gene_type:complete